MQNHEVCNIFENLANKIYFRIVEFSELSIKANPLIRRGDSYLTIYAHKSQ